MADTHFYRTLTISQVSDPDNAERLQQLWETPPGLHGWLTTVDHKTIGIRYLVTSFAFLLRGGLEALAMRLQLAHADQHVLTPEQYNQVFTMHGITMIFLYALPTLSLSFFGIASVVIVIPSAVAVFAWIATIWLGRPVFTVPFLFFASFVLLFVIGGVSGFMTAAVPFDWQLTDTYFVVAHLHYVLLGINVFPVLGGIYFWFPKMTGKMMDEGLGRWNFWLMFIGFNLAFFPMHITGLLGMPRRIYRYPSGYGWDTLNFVTTIGAFLFAIGVLLFLINIMLSLRQGKPAGPNPWDASSLEWSVSSPPPPYNFIVIPKVASRYSLWESYLDEEGSGSVIDQGPLLAQGRETLGTTALDSEPDIIFKMPSDSFAPLIMSLLLTALCYGALIHSG